MNEMDAPDKYDRGQDYNPEIIIAYGAFVLGGFLMGILFAWLIVWLNNA